MDVYYFPIFWLNRLKLKIFVINSICDIFPNLWCLCDKVIDPDIVGIGNKHISFTFKLNEQTLGISVVLNHASLPWCFIGDVNTIIGAHEYIRSYSHARGPMEEFSDWTNINHLVHIPTTVAKFNLSNGRSGPRHTQKRLYMSICNQN